MPSIDPRDLKDLASLAARGGLGRGVATTDCVAQEPDQLMFIRGDELILLREMPDCLIASCEGVVGWVKKGLVVFQGVAGASSYAEEAGSDIIDTPDRDDLPRTILIAPSPPLESKNLPQSEQGHLSAPESSLDGKRTSSPFELDSGPTTPSVEHSEFSLNRPDPPLSHDDEDRLEEQKRNSTASISSSEAFGGIGGFMMGDSNRESLDMDGSEELLDDTSRTSASLHTPNTSRLSPNRDFDDEPLALVMDTPSSDKAEWDMYNDYRRESLFLQHRPQSKDWSRDKHINRASTDSMDGQGAVHAAMVALAGARSPVGEIPEMGLPVIDPVTPKVEKEDAHSPLQMAFSGRSIATELRLRIQREREKGQSGRNSMTQILPVTPRVPSVVDDGNDVEAAIEFPVQDRDHDQKPIRPPRRTLTQPSTPILDEAPVAPNSEPLVQPVKPEVLVITPEEQAPVHNVLEDLQGLDASALPSGPTSKHGPPSPGILQGLMASPMPLDDNSAVANPSPPEMPSPAANDLLASPMNFSTPPNWSPNLSANVPGLKQPWSPSSPSSPHSVTATRQAVEVVKAAPSGRRPRGLTLVGRMELDLSASRDPVPITFSIAGPGMAGEGIGLGLTPVQTPLTPRSRSPLATPILPLPDDLQRLRSEPGRFPAPQRSVTSPITDSTMVNPPPRAVKPRSQSFSSSVARAKTDLIIDTSSPHLPSLPKGSVFGIKTAKNTPVSPKLPSPSTAQSNTSMPSLLSPTSARSASFSSAYKGSRMPRKTSRTLPSPVSNKDYEDTVIADGTDFELVQPKKMSSAPHSPISQRSMEDDRTTENSAMSGKILPETDEWGFVKERSTIPEIFMSRSAPGEHRAVEQKWLSVVSSPLPQGGPPKKVRKLAVESGIPSSLRGRAWAWFMSPAMSARRPGLYEELCRQDRPCAYSDQIERDVETLWSDHSIFYSSSTPGRSDLRSILHAYSNFAPSGYSTPMCMVAGTLLIHSVAEEAFWSLSGLINTALKDYYARDGPGLRIDAGVFETVIRGSEKELYGALRQAGVKGADFVDKWYKQIFIRCLPWPTTLRVIDAVVSEGPRFLFIAALTILTLSRERLLALPRAREPILQYLHNLPQDSLFLPENFMKACEKVRFREEDYVKLRRAVEKDMGLA